MKHKGLVLSCSMSGSEEWWFDVRPKGVGKKRRCTIDELCPESSESSSALDAMTARWYEAFETRVTASQSTHRSEWSVLIRFLLHTNNSEVGGVLIGREFRSTLTKDSFALKSWSPG